MSRMPWFRVYSDILSDRKIKRICKITGESKAVIIGVWIILLSLSNESPERGKLQLCDELWLSVEELEEETQLDPTLLVELLKAFHELKMLNGQPNELEITNWDKRQFKSDNSTDRVRIHREKVKRSDETLPKRSDETLPKRSDETLQNRYRAEQNRTEAEIETDTTATFDKLVNAFVNASGIPDFGMKPRDVEAGQKMVKSGVKPKDVTEAVKELQSKNYNIVGLASVETASYSVMGKRKTITVPDPRNVPTEEY